MFILGHTVASTTSKEYLGKLVRVELHLKFLKKLGIDFNFDHIVASSYSLSSATRGASCRCTPRFSRLISLFLLFWSCPGSSLVFVRSYMFVCIQLSLLLILPLALPLQLCVSQNWQECRLQMHLHIYTPVCYKEENWSLLQSLVITGLIYINPGL